MGSGPYMMVKNDQQRDHPERNPNSRRLLPREVSPGDAGKACWTTPASGCRSSTGQCSAWKKVLPLWTKFLQVTTTVRGECTATPTAYSTRPSWWVPGVEMSPERWPITTSPRRRTSSRHLPRLQHAIRWSAATEDRRKLRQAPQIAFNTEEYINIFYKGNGSPRGTLIHPGIPGTWKGSRHQPPASMTGWTASRCANPLITPASCWRRPVTPNGRDANRRTFFEDFHRRAVPGDQQHLHELDGPGVRRTGSTGEYRSADWNHPGETADREYPDLSHGWLADYPDPENFCS